MNSRINKSLHFGMVMLGLMVGAVTAPASTTPVGAPAAVATKVPTLSTTQVSKPLKGAKVEATALAGKVKAACSAERITELKAGNGGVLPVPSKGAAPAQPATGIGGNPAVMGPGCPSRCTDFGDCCVCPGDN